MPGISFNRTSERKNSRLHETVVTPTACKAFKKEESSGGSNSAHRGKVSILIIDFIRSITFKTERLPRSLVGVVHVVKDICLTSWS